MSFETPILFLVFNRPETTREVFGKIREIKPKYLFVSADGARNSEEEDKCIEVRNIVSKVDWDCEVKTLYRDKNLGCGIAVSEGITWFFSQVEQGIILEDDCLPDSSFFNFCEVLLDKYRDDKRVWHISGNNFQNGIKRGEGSYYFSMYNHVWGWATWRNRWQEYQFDISAFNLEQDLKFYTSDSPVLKYFKRRQKQVRTGIINTWDYQWLFSMWKNKGLAALPNLNLVSNIGFGVSATNTSSSSSSYIVNSSSIENIAHPIQVIQNQIADKYSFRNIQLKSLGILSRVKMFFTL